MKICYSLRSGIYVECNISSYYILLSYFSTSIVKLCNMFLNSSKRGNITKIKKQIRDCYLELTSVDLAWFLIFFSLRFFWNFAGVTSKSDNEGFELCLFLDPDWYFPYFLSSLFDFADLSEERADWELRRWPRIFKKLWKNNSLQHKVSNTNNHVKKTLTMRTIYTNT